MLAPVLIAILVLTGCGETAGIVSSESEEIESSMNTDAASNSAQVTSYSVQSTSEGTGITSLQAAKIGYNEAIKWRSDAVLWSIQPMYYSLDANWSDNDLSELWVVIFACRADETCYTVTIQNGEVIGSSEVTSTVRGIDIPASAPVDQPKISMQEAAEVAIESGMPSHPSDVMIMYLIESYTEEWSGKPFWQFGFTVSDIAYFCAVDGVTGKLIDLVDAYGNSVDPMSIQSNPETPEGYSEDVVIAFFNALNKGDSEEAFSFMLSAKSSDSVTKAAWKAGFDSIESIKVNKIEDFLTDSWLDGHEYYKCYLSVTLKSGAVMSVWEDGEIVRYLHMEGENGVWKVSEISTNP